MSHLSRYTDTIRYPHLIEAAPNLVLAQFEVMKLIPAEYIIDRALERGELQPGGTVLEVSSGTFALALALVTRSRGLRLKLVTIDIDACLLWRLRSLGAEVHVVREPDASGSIQKTQLAILQRLQEETPGAYWCAQYRNPDNPRSYRGLADDLRARLGRIDVLVGTVGTGGSVSGTSAALRPHLPALTTVGVDSPYSVTFVGCGEAADPACKFYMDNMLGLGSRVDIPVMDHTEFDEVHWVPFRAMVAAAHDLHMRTGLLIGPTGGAAYLVARAIAAQRPEARVLAMLPDTGLRYVGSVYEPGFVERLGITPAHAEGRPRVIGDIAEIGPGWCSFPWARAEKRTLAALAA
ncbi:pyridoxal-phosphate dependent enzyme [Salinarimonas chemoclinalis]|uniref:pyridoxal-phosphate dependent enzyme n=1 Tax=Salinarimonas chemoclinalis TaxID=3241599 RepID=UPI003558F53F